MEFISTVLARSAFLVEIEALDPFGKRTAAEAVAEIKQRYNFAFIPEAGRSIDNDKGLEFSSGRLKDVVIDKLTIFQNGIVVDTRSTTENAESVASDFIAACKEALGAKVGVERKHVTSQVTFRSDFKLTEMNPVLQEICEAINLFVSTGMKQAYTVEPVGILFNADATQTRFMPSKFTIERRADVPFFENTYFSSAPLPTRIHWELLEKFEKSLL
jgi:hypothetical protein